MSPLRNVETRISGLVDRVFGRMFRGHVELVELARKLGREMEDHKTVSVSRVYVPNEYVIYLSATDRERFSSFERSATKELGDYLTERARHEGFTLLSTPDVRMETDRDLRIGEYGIACRVVDPPQTDADAADEARDEAGVERPAAKDVPFAPYEPASDSVFGKHFRDPEVPTPKAPDEDRASADAAQAGAEAPVADAADGGGPVMEVPSEPEAATPAEESRVEDGVAWAEAAAPAAPLPVTPEPAVVAPVAEPEPVAEAEVEVEVEPAPAPPADPAPQQPVVRVSPLPPVGPPAPPDPVVMPPKPPPVPEAPAPRPRPAAPEPLPAPGGYEPLAGVSGTQMMPPARSADDDFVQEEVSLIIDGRRHRLTKRTTTLGRSRDCDIPVSDPNASRHHAEIRHIGLDYFLVDQGSTNGTYVNGQRVRRHAIADGDRLTIGTTEMVVEHLQVRRP